MWRNFILFIVFGINIMGFFRRIVEFIVCRGERVYRGNIDIFNLMLGLRGVFSD